jgi:hypothetical protein
LTSGYPTRGYVKYLYQSALDDWPQTSTSPYQESVFAPAFDQAYNALFNALLNAQGAKIEIMTSVQLAPFTCEATPADLGISGMGEPIFLREKIFGSNEKWKPMDPVDVLSQRQPNTYLREYNWRNNTFYFIGATDVLDLQIKYEASSCPPTSDTASICVDSCANFLANFAIGVSGGRKGDDATMLRCWKLAVGPKYEEGVIGGQLYMLIQPSVRNRQNVQISHRPYTTWGRPFTRRGAIPYVAAQQGTTGGGANNVPIQFSTAANNIIGPINGVNTVFWVNCGNVATMIVSVNGVDQTIGTDYTFINNQITFSTARIPQIGDIITAEVWLVNPVNYGSATVSQAQNRVRACGPGSIRGTDVELSTATGTITGLVNGSNSLFFLKVAGPILSAQVFNGVIQTEGYDYSRLGNQIAFYAASIPQPGAIITAEVQCGPNV